MKQHQFLKDIDPRFQLLGWRVGLFASVIGLIIVILVLVLAERQGLFNSKTRVHFIAESGAGLVPGMQVRLSGFRIGVVDEVALDGPGMVDVDLLIEQQYMKWVKSDSIAILQQEGVIGDHFIEISGGTKTGKELAEGGTLSFVPAMGLADIAVDLRNRTVPIFDSIQQTLDYLNDPKGDIRQTLTNVQQLTAEVRQTREKVDQVLLRADGLLDQEGRATLASADKLLNRADVIASEVAKQLPHLFAGAASTMVSVQALSNDASAAMHMTRKTVEKSAPYIPGLIRDSDALIQRGDQTLEGLQQTWPLSRAFSTPALLAPTAESR
ncbi:MCE family protein [Chitinibacter bivalviorum]|uniref:MCE family protein n=1 Tax=Chitinibacter bivalviorum TaxID=2739434 RepID=A0A7H9BK79_9NEIS|nr:MlaD family protein [Chitinibacter bivalviorum]QLG87894.1 MCE family protein [Chitinibacter bivalviorum]